MQILKSPLLRKAQDTFSSKAKLLLMFYFPLIFLAALTLIFANPIPDDSVDLDSDLNTISFDPNLDVNIEHNLVSSAFPSNEIVVANSKADTQPECTTDSLTDIDPDDNIQKRFKVCPAYPIPQTPSQTHPQRPIEEPNKATSTETNPCEETRPHYVSCGGPEATDTRIAPILGAVLNCVPGMIFRLLHTILPFHQAKIFCSDRRIHTSTQAVSRNQHNC